MKKGLMMIALGLALIACGVVSARAEGEAGAGQVITASGINIKDIVSNTRAGVWLPLEGGKTFKTVYTPLVWVHDSSGVEFAALDVGAAAPGEITQGYVFVSIGLRADNLLDRFLGISKWMKAHVSSATLPSMEMGVGGILYQSKVRAGASLALKF